MSGVLTIFQMSDLHFGKHHLPPIADSLLRAVEELEPDIIVASGDFTQRAKEEEYRQARDYLDRLPDSTPVVVTPGNHDVPLYRVLERIFSPYDLYRRYISDALDTVLRRDDVVIVALNSTSPRRAIVNGRIGMDQLEFCERAFEDAPAEAIRIVVAHHHFAPAPDFEGGQVMPGAKRAVDLFGRLNVDVLMGGHMHRAYIGNTLDVYPGIDPNHGIIIVQCGTSASRRGRAREREKNSFNLVRITDELVRITHYMHFDQAGGFAPVSRHIFTRGRREYFTDAVGLEEAGMVSRT